MKSFAAGLMGLLFCSLAVATAKPITGFKGFVKIAIGLAKGKKLHDKRETLMKKDVEREMKRYLK